MTETPSHAELVTAIEQVRATCEPVVTEDGYYSDAALAINRRRETLAALLDALADILIIAADIRCPECLDYHADCYVYEQADALRATVTTALRKMGALT